MNEQDKSGLATPMNLQQALHERVEELFSQENLRRELIDRREQLRGELAGTDEAIQKTSLHIAELREEVVSRVESVSPVEPLTPPLPADPARVPRGW